ncbi:hypothetical protein [Ovoidimarina sediminis]|uniref:hypothetical protein n=1 Tax=Ovoidimarina sediminis TaxID=3079856 RepID=UPI00290F463C|nr:hypothetical protein [Rhodophyticola sp. MJ-SS7]MDU8946462.1 hypothetical protein [Rhodophyticola sp. MJ-SS7]
MDNGAGKTPRVEGTDDVARIAEELNQLRARLEDLESPSAKSDEEHTLSAHPDIRRAASALLDLIERHPIRAAAIAFLLGALLFRGRR